MVNGSPGHLVYFTSYRDDSIRGDTDGGGSSSGSPADWGWIEFTPSSDDASTISFAVIRFGGYSNAGTPTYTGNLYIQDASPTIQYTTLKNGYHGIFANTTSPNLICNDIYNNQNYGLFNATTGTGILAEYQWWGSPSGPYHPTNNQSGTGNRVSDGVIFSPWATQSCLTPPGTFSKTGPVNGLTGTTTNPTLNWETSAGASSYEFCYDTSNNNVCDTNWTSMGTSTHVDLSGLANYTTYHWQVRALNTVGAREANSNTWWSFTTVPILEYLPLLIR